MTASAEPGQREAGGGPLGDAWRGARAAMQEAVLPSGRALVSCQAPLGLGGLGRHQRELLDAFARRGTSATSLSAEDRAAARGGRRRFESGAWARPLARFSPGWRAWSHSVAFDAYAARALPRVDHLLAFNGAADAQFAAARRAGVGSLSLVAANSHLRRVQRQHALALRRYPVERSWAEHLLARNLREYEQADRIYVASRYTWESFVQEGVPEERLSLFPLTPDPRYTPAPAPAATVAAGTTVVPDTSVAAGTTVAPDATDTFDVVYVGGLTVPKGVALLIDAVARLAHRDLRLVLVGGWSTRGMRRLIERARALDPRILVSPGDPLTRLRGASLCVHPTYEDGFAYAPAEALAAGVSVIVSEDTGMKELIDSERHGVVVPTGDLDALAHAIEAAYAGEILRG